MVKNRIHNTNEIVNIDKNNSKIFVKFPRIKALRYQLKTITIK